MAFDPEKYLASKASAGFNPEKFLAKKMAETPVVDEMPEWLSDTDRLKAQNLTNSDEEKVAFLQKQYPDAQVMSSGDKILLRKKGEKNYMVLDPSMSMKNFFSKETLRDAGDIIGDVGAGVAEATGAAAGAATGFLAGGYGALPGTMIGSGVASGAYSDAKERLAEALGVKGYDASKVAQDAAWGAALPGAFHVAGKGVKAAAKKVAPALYAKATGFSVDALKDIADGAAGMDAQGPARLIREISEATAQNVDESKKVLGEQFNAIRGSGAKVDMVPVAAEFDRLIGVAKEKRVRSGLSVLSEEEKALREMKDRILGGVDNYGNVRTKQGIKVEGTKTAAPEYEQTFDPIFGGGVKRTGTDGVAQYVDDGLSEVQHYTGAQDVSDAMDVKSILKDYIDYNPAIGGNIGKSTAPVTRQEQDAAIKLAKILDDQMYGTDPNKRKLLENYGELVEKARYLNKKFGNDESAMHTMRNLAKGKNHILNAEIDTLPQQTKDLIKKNSNRIKIHEFFNAPEEGNYIKRGTEAAIGKSPLSKLLSIGGGVVGGTVGGLRGGIVGGAAGRGLGELLTSPENVKRLTKFGKDTGLKMDGIEELLRNNPEYLPIIFGTSYGAAKSRD